MLFESLEHKLSPKFCYYVLLSERARQLFRKGYGKKALAILPCDDKDFDSLDVPLPPLPEQEQIAAYLDASCGSIDAAVAAKRQQLGTLDQLSQSKIHRAVTEESICDRQS